MKNDPLFKRLTCQLATRTFSCILCACISDACDYQLQLPSWSPVVRAGMLYHDVSSISWGCSLFMAGDMMTHDPSAQTPCTPTKAAMMAALQLSSKAFKNNELGVVDFGSGHEYDPV